MVIFKNLRRGHGDSALTAEAHYQDGRVLPVVLYGQVVDGVLQPAPSVSAEIVTAFQAALAAGAEVGPPRRFRSLDEAQGERIRQIKAEAARRIALIAPDWRQRNVLASGDNTSIAGLWGLIDAVRAASDSIEADIADASHDALEALDITIDDRWPE